MDAQIALESATGIRNCRKSRHLCQCNSRSQQHSYYLDKDTIAADLNDGPKGEKPEWELSSYGPGRDAPRQLLEGALEQSPQEMRVLCYMAMSENKLQDYVRCLKHKEGPRADVSSCDMKAT